MTPYQKAEYARQASFFQQLENAQTGHQGSEVMLIPEYSAANLHPGFASDILAFFAYNDEQGGQAIDWHTRANHGASSQVCCLNFLFPMVDDQTLASAWVDHVLGIEGAKVEPIETRCGKDCYVTFEWFPETDYLNEANVQGLRPRGSNSTSVDAALCYRHGDKRHLLMIEWKYTEAYGASRDAKDLAGDTTRLARYTNIWKRPHGPIRTDAQVDLQDFFLNPWYQLLRQQMLAYHCEVDPLSGYDRVTILHISPSGNDSLKAAKGVLAQKTGATDVFEGFRSLLAPEFSDRFVAVDTSSAFNLPAYQANASYEWVVNRYVTLLR